MRSTFGSSMLATTISSVQSGMSIAASVASKGLSGAAGSAAGSSTGSAAAGYASSSGGYSAALTNMPNNIDKMKMVNTVSKALWANQVEKEKEEA